MRALRGFSERALRVTRRLVALFHYVPIPVLGIIIVASSLQASCGGGGGGDESDFFDGDASTVDAPADAPSQDSMADRADGMRYGDAYLP